VSVKASSSDNVTLKIPRPLYNRLRQLIAGTGFHSVTEFAVFVLRDIASPPAQQGVPEGSLTREEVEAVRQRLRKLGYL
jgi:hypothetical protein